jgi:hypothetical protein
MGDAERQLEDSLARYTPEIAGRARLAIEALHRRLPQATRTIYDNYNALGVGFGPDESAANVVVSIVAYPRWVTLFFMHGAMLPDPDGVLKGSGSRVRSVKIAGPSDLDRPAIARLIDAAVAAAKRPFPAEGVGPLIVKGVSEKRRPRRPSDF